MWLLYVEDNEKLAQNTSVILRKKAILVLGLPDIDG